MGYESGELEGHIYGHGLDCSNWGIKIGWWGQQEWRREMTLLQNTVLRKTLGTVRGSSGKKVNAIAAVEDVETFAKAASTGY